MRADRCLPLALLAVVLGCAGAVPQIAAGPRFGEMTLMNHLLSRAIVTVTGPDGAIVHRTVLPGNSHKFVRLPSVPSVRVNVVRVPDRPAPRVRPARAERSDRPEAARDDAAARRRTRAFVGSVLGGATKGKRPATKGTHYHNGVPCEDPNCPENAGSAPAGTSGGEEPRHGTGHDPIVRGVLDALDEAAEEEEEEEEPTSRPSHAGHAPTGGASTPASGVTEETATVGVAAAGEVVEVTVNGVGVRITCTTGAVDPCDELRARISQVRAQLDAARQALDARTAECPALQAELDAAEQALRDAERDLQNASTPPDEGRDYVEDGRTGRRITNRDLRLRRAASRAAWDRYRNGEISADDLVREWERQGEDGALDRIRGEDDAVREAARKRAEEARDAARARRDAARQAHEAKEAEKARLAAEIAQLEADLARLVNDLDECARRARAEAEARATREREARERAERETRERETREREAQEREVREEAARVAQEEAEAEQLASAPWGGGVADDGLTVIDCCDLIEQVIEEIAASSFGQTTRGAGIVEVLRSYACGDITFVVTTDNASGRGQTTPTVDDEGGVIPGNARYVRTMRMGVPGVGGVIHSNEIYLGIDGSSIGLRIASRNPAAYYICEHEGVLCVINRAELIDSLVHEGLHAAQGGAQNAGGGASNQEERDAHAAGNEVRAAFGFPADPETPGYGGNNAGYTPYTGE